MDRRTFLKSIGIAAAALTALLAKPATPEITKIPDGDLVYVNGQDLPFDWKPCGGIEFTSNIVAVSEYQGRMLVFCEDSIWEMQPDKSGPSKNHTFKLREIQGGIDG